MMLEPVAERFAELCKIKRRPTLMQSDATENIVQHRSSLFDDLVCVHGLSAYVIAVTGVRRLMADKSLTTPPAKVGEAPSTIGP